MKKNLMKSAAMGALLLSMAACNGKTSTGEATCCAAAGEGQCTEQCGQSPRPALPSWAGPRLS